MARVEKKTSGRGRQKAGGAGESLEELLAKAKDHMEVGKYGKAASALKKVLGDHPDHWEALRLSATLNLKLGSLFAARSSFESLARQAFERQDYLLAQSLLKEYLGVVPRYIPFLELLGHAMEGSGNPNGALVEYGKALSFIQESEDAEQKDRGPQIYLRVKTLDPDGPVTKRLAEAYEPLMASHGDAAAAPPSAAPSESSRWDSSTAEPAPFPWEVSQSTEPEAGGVAAASATSEPEMPAASSDSPSEASAFAAEMAAPAVPETPTTEPLPVTVEPRESDLTGRHVRDDSPAATEAPETPSLEEPRPDPTPTQGIAEAEPPAPEPKSRGFFGFRFASGSSKAMDEPEGEAAQRSTTPEERVEPEEPRFTPAPADLSLELPEPEPEPEPTPSVALEAEPDSGPTEPAPRTKRSRRRPAETGAPTAPASVGVNTPP